VAPEIRIHRKFSSWFIPSTIIGTTSLSQLKENVSHTRSKQITACSKMTLWRALFLTQGSSWSFLVLLLLVHQALKQIDAFNVELKEGVLQKIDQIHVAHLDPCAAL
jgi:aryl-alcohol dehydrogenase-like predicted oxidoreductase